MINHLSLHFEGPTANGLGSAEYEAKSGCLHAPKLTVHTSALQHTESVSFSVQVASAQVYSQLNVVTSYGIASYNTSREVGNLVTMRVGL